MRAGQRASVLPPKSDVNNLFCYREAVVDLEAEISDGTLDLVCPRTAAHPKRKHVPSLRETEWYYDARI